MIDSSAPRSRLLAKTIDRLKEVLPRPLLHQARRAAIAWATRGQQITTKVDPANLAALEGDLQCAIQAVRAIGAIPVLLTHANRFGTLTKPDDDYWLTGWRNQYPEYSERMLLELEHRANIVVEQTARTQAVALVESSAALSGHRELFADHAHFNDQGSAHLGKVLADALIPMLSKP